MTTHDRTHCPDLGEWRAWLDHEVVASQSLEDHLPTCPACQRLVDELGAEGSEVRDILSVLAPTRLPDAAEIALARERLEWRRAAAARPFHPTHIRQLEPIPMFFSRLSTPWRFAASGVAAALLVGLLIAFTPEGGAMAASILSQFRSQQVTAIEVSPESQADIMKTMNALGNLGTISGQEGNGPVKPQVVARNAEAQQRTITLAEAAQTITPFLTPDPATLPAGIPATPAVHMMPQTQVQFTFSKAKAAAYFKSTGHPEVSLPDKYDGATLTVTMPKAVLLEYGDNKSRNGLFIAEAGEVTADVQGNASLPEMRDFILGLPGLPPTVVSQLKAINSWSDTLPIPVPLNMAQWKPFDAPGGGKGLMLYDNSGVGSAAIWHASGHLYGVGGSIKSDDLMNIVKKMAVR